MGREERGKRKVDDEDQKIEEKKRDTVKNKERSNIRLDHLVGNSEDSENIIELKTPKQSSCRTSTGARKDSDQNDNQVNEKGDLLNTSIDKSTASEPIKEPAATKPESRKTEVDTSEEDLLGLDDGELEELRKLKTKYKEEESSDDNDCRENKAKKQKTSSPSQASPALSRSSSGSRSPRKRKKEEFRVLESSSVGSLQLKYRYLDENYGLRYEKHDLAEKKSYCKEDFREVARRRRQERGQEVGRRQERSWASEEFTGGSQRMLAVAGRRVVEGERTPERGGDGDSTPVYGSLESSLEQEVGEGEVRQPVGWQEQEQVQEPQEIEQCFEEVNVESSFEVERPPSPEAIGLEEEEGMEWEEGVVEEVVQEVVQGCQRLRAQMVEVEGMEGVEEEEEVKETARAEVGRLVVVDTCVLLSALALVEALVQEGRCTVYLPWQVNLDTSLLFPSTALVLVLTPPHLQVLQELDRHKSSQETGARGRAAVRWVSRLQEARHSGLQTQGLAQQRRAVAGHLGPGDGGPDDRILATCLQLGDLETPTLLLLTDDASLANKSRANGVEVASSVTARARLEGGAGEESETGVPRVSGEVVEGARAACRDLLEAVLVREFQEAYGPKLWKRIVFIQPAASPPRWSLANLLKLYNKHHIAVFGLAFPHSGHSLRTALENLAESLKSGDTSLVNIVLQLVQVVKERDSYDGVVELVEERLEALQATTTSKLKICSPLDNQEAVAGLFQTVGEIMAAFTRAFAATLGVPSHIPVFPPEITWQGQDEAASALPSFLRAVSGLWEALADVVGGKEQQTAALHSRLVGFRAAVGQEGAGHWPVDESRVTVAQLAHWVEQTREAVVGGLGQVQGFRDVLVACSRRLGELEEEMD